MTHLNTENRTDKKGTKRVAYGRLRFIQKIHPSQLPTLATLSIPQAPRLSRTLEKSSLTFTVTTFIILFERHFKYFSETSAELSTLALLNQLLTNVQCA